MRWLNKLAENLDSSAGEAVRKKVMKSSDKGSRYKNLPDFLLLWSGMVYAILGRNPRKTRKN